MTAKVEATLELRPSPLQGDSVREGKSAGKLEGRTDGSRSRRNRNRSSPRGEGITQTDDTGVDVQTTRPARLCGREGKHTRTVLGHDISARPEAEGVREGQRIA